MAQLRRVHESFRNYLEDFGYVRRGCEEQGLVVAYFSAEVGLSEALPIYSGGLGMLAGDHLKSASDLGVPLVGVGLLYQKGYFRQFLNADGWQQEQNPENDFYNLPLSKCKDEAGNPLTVAIQFPTGPLYCRIWMVQVIFSSSQIARARSTLKPAGLPSVPE